MPSVWCSAAVHSYFTRCHFSRAEQCKRNSGRPITMCSNCARRSKLHYKFFFSIATSLWVFHSIHVFWIIVIWMQGAAYTITAICAALNDISNRFFNYRGTCSSFVFIFPISSRAQRVSHMEWSCLKRKSKKCCREIGWNHFYWGTEWIILIS